MDLADVPRGWVEGLAAALEAGNRRPVADARAAAGAYASRLPASYFERTTPAAAARDLAEFEALGPSPDDARMAVQPDPDPGAGMFRFRRYGRQGIELSSFLPILESFGLIVVEAVPHRADGAPSGQAPLHLDDFGLRAAGRWGFEPDADGTRLVQAVQAAWRGEAEVDSLNRLVVSARLAWRDVLVLRAYRRYRRQAGTTWSDRQLDDPLVSYPEFTVSLLRYFGAKFDPAGPPGPEPAETARRRVLDGLGAVDRLEQDQVLRGYLNLVDATLRTSHYVTRRDGAPPETLTLKLDSSRVPELPPPRPYVETFVYSPRVECLHLRGGPIARGGIRWSDRQHDLRTEVLGLVRAQVLKNAGIVPTGAKGGFVCRRLDPRATPVGETEHPPLDVVNVVKDGYRLFVSGLLDVTDNVVGGAVVTPPGVRPADAEDTYLVVAADRGTAPLSDLANRISAQYGFWLGDAFASGGSHGYDHKAMGITARGAWVAVQQHFRQLGIDVQAEPVRTVGVGDMSGDVFGNGMLRSETIELIAAFDNRDIFVDPSPDAARSYRERRRLFELPGSSWRDYDQTTLSPGGGVWSRTSKQIELSPEARRALGLNVATISPPELVSAILAASCDLLWLGGIGTFVKAQNESNAEVGDHGNDTIRVNADQLRARVVAEGGNLGFTQRARIAYSRRGGRINTDFIDNAAGVATSDREVNIKILLASAIEARRLSPGSRDGLLASVQNDVAESVLRALGLSALTVTRAVPASADDLDAYESLMTKLEVGGRLDRKVEALPDGEEMAVRRAAGAGLTRPEAAVLFAHAKSDLADALEPSPLALDFETRGAVEAYFPPAVSKGLGDLIAEHRLYVQLCATIVAGEIVDRMGITWAHETADEFGVELADMAVSYWAARQVIDADGRWRQVEALAPRVSADAEAVLHHAVATTVDTLTRRYLAERPVNLHRRVVEDRPVSPLLAAVAQSAGMTVAGNGSSLDVDALVEQGVDSVAAASFAALPLLASVADVAWAVRRLRRPVPEVASAFSAVDDALRLPALEAGIASVHTDSRWERWQARSLLDDISRIRREVVVGALSLGSQLDPRGAIDAFVAARGAARWRSDRFTRRVDSTRTDALAVAALAVRSLSDLADAPD